MSEGNSITSTVTVAVDPMKAFKVFTEEINCWWLQGPINFHDSTRAHEMKIESGVGGRILEVYDLDAGEGLELGRITEWEPGTKLAWKSSIDDVVIDIRFEPAADGTEVTVTATIPPGGKDKGGTAWVRTTSVWLGRWVEKREQEQHRALKLSRLGLAVNYADPARAAQWLRDVFRFEPATDIPSESNGGEAWIEFHVGEASLIISSRSEGAATGAITHTPWIFVDDLDGQYESAKQGGAEIVEEITHYGARWFTAADLENNRWTFAQASPQMRGN